MDVSPVPDQESADLQGTLVRLLISESRFFFEPCSDGKRIPTWSWPHQSQQVEGAGVYLPLPLRVDHALSVPPWPPRKRLSTHEQYSAAVRGLETAV
ncbi:uncharacterized protein SPSK_08183 [Sporothrix schenckii 1099-18]|uniref:Uncharacterized protein n=1 Tax=Sporothrix schenckii 1099-18 TaxID=1397361 RepID=A0A0F2MFD7_SPOSC|nr:uncharacterized protein SPSK_08183 [Sporothrix schenckii 1099-18]KJR88413.1 hypothetical protein SPSK_08183 [Sporothrix schenckii 1099-18]